MKKFEVCVMNMETYTVYANTKRKAIIQAIDCFRDDDEFYDTEEAENVTDKDCKIVWEEKC